MTRKKPKISRIRKRDGKIVKFEPKKIANAIHKAILAVKGKDGETAETLSRQVVAIIEEEFAGKIPTVEDVQDIVEKVLIKNGYTDVAKAYILYRQKRTELREAKKLLGVTDDLKLSVNAVRVLERRYLLKDDEGKIIETPSEMFRRVAKAIAAVDHLYNKEADVVKTEEEFYRVMANLDFLPNSPTLMNAGTDIGQLSACFTEEQPILTEQGFKPISELKVGDCVITHLGRIRRVTDRFVREIDGHLLRIKVKGLYKNSMSVTPEHPILAVKRDDVQCIRNKRLVCNGFPKKRCFEIPLNYKNDCPFLRETIVQPRWIMAKDLEEGDYVVVNSLKETKDVETLHLMDYLNPSRYAVIDNKVYRQNKDKRLRCGKISKQVKPVTNLVKVDGDLLRLFGYYLSEGEVEQGSCVRFTLNKNEIRIAEEILQIIQDKFSLTPSIEEQPGNWISIRFHSVTLASFFKALFGAGFDNKDLPKWIMLLPPEKQLQLLTGLFKGDGGHYNGKKQDRVYLSLSNYNLSTKIWAILMRLGYQFTINQSSPKGATRTAYRIEAAPSECEELVKAIKKNVFHRRRRFPQYIKLGDCFLRPISKIEKAKFKGKVYNLEVEEDNSYLANGVAVHNCFVLPVEDSMEDIFNALKYMALIHKSGGGCIAEGSKVFTTYCGIENIEKIYQAFSDKKGEIVNTKNSLYIDVADDNIYTLSFNNETGKIERDKVTKFWKFRLQKKSICTIKTTNGIELTTSVWHPFIVFENGMIIKRRADQIKAGNLLILPNKTALSVWPFKNYNIVDEIKIDEDVAWLIGYFLGDGSLGLHRRNFRLRFYGGDRKLIEEARRILNEKFKATINYVHRDPRSDNGVYSIVTMHQKAIEKFMKIIEINTYKKRKTGTIPKIITKSPVSVMAAFIAGLLDSDGCVAKNRPRLTLNTANEELANETCALLNLMGIRTSVRVRKPRNKLWSPIYEIKIDGYDTFEMLYPILGPYVKNESKKSLIEKYKKYRHTKSGAMINIPFKTFEYALKDIGIKTRGTEVWRKAVKIGGRRFWLHRWKEGYAIDKRDFKELLQAILSEKPDKAIRKKVRMYLGIIDSLAKVAKVEQGKSDGIFYDFTVRKNNNYFAGRFGLAVIHNTGFSFSKLRPKGDIVKSTKGVASGPVSFMQIFDAATDVIKQGGKRRGANMGILRVDHPDIIEFVTAKGKEGVLANFNVSVAITDDFMKAVESDAKYDLINPRTGKAEKKLSAKDVFDLIVTMAWRTGDPGLIFIDEINRHNPTPLLGKIESTNPCGEVPLLPYESCNLGSINLSRMVKDGEIDWDKLRRTVRTAVHFLDNVIDANRYPIPQIEKSTKATRKIGLGVMGFAEMLIELNIPYDSEEAVATAEKVMKFINDEARKKSIEIALRRGSFPEFRGSIWEKRGYEAIRNATLTTIAPTGSISIIANTSSGIEPLFAISFVRNVMGTQLIEVNSIFERVAKEKGFYNGELMIKIAKEGSIQKINEIPQELRRVFVTALDIAPEWHVKIQAAFQKYVDNAVAKTVNLPNEATLEDVRRIFLLAYNMKCKGTTVYRYGSKREQVLYVGPISSAQTTSEKYVTADAEYAGECPTGVCPF